MDRHERVLQSGEKGRLEVKAMLRQVGLRPTRQRIALAEILFGGGDRHFCAEDLREEARAAGVPVSIATIYNSLHHFTKTGLLREIGVDGLKTYFDTNTGEHQHFFVEGDNQIFDVPKDTVRVSRVPEPPPGFRISRVDVVVRLRRIAD